MKVSLGDALLALDVSNDNHWTAEGLPRVETIQALTGESTDRKKISAFAPAFNRSNPSLEPVDEIVKTADELPGVTTAQNSQGIEAEIDTDEASDEEQLHAYNVGLESLYKQRDELISAIQRIEQARDIIVMRLDDKIADNTPSTIQGYLASQRKHLESRGLVQKQIVESGVDLGALQKAIAPAPIDAKRRR